MAMPSTDARLDPGSMRREVAVIGASAGGVEALTTLVRGIPPDVPLSLAIVLHMPTTAESRLAEILARVGPLPASRAEHGAKLEQGTIVVAPPGRHLVISNDRTYLLDGPRENGFRPAIDPLFRSAARSLGPRAIGVILSGTMDDGAAGLVAIQAFGGATVVQDPDDALASGMPKAALDLMVPDHVGAATGLGRVLDAIARSEVVLDSEAASPRRAAAGLSLAAVRGDATLIADPMELVPHGVDLACPECGGALQEILVGSMSRFRCRTGHIYSAMTLLETKGAELEAALWAAVRALEEEASVAGRMASRSRQYGAEAAAKRFDARQGDAAERADLVREAIHSIGSASQAGPDEAVTSAEPGVASA
jgi:two-component system chemotaxis response regulator CheB